MKPPAKTRIGDGGPPRVVAELRRQWPGMEVTFRGDDIRRPTDWRIREPRHAIVAHLGGRMTRLETELEGHGGSSGPALPGEIWTVPAERRYASHACGTVIEYAVILLDAAAENTLREDRVERRDIAPLAAVRDEFLHHALLRLCEAMRAPDDLSAMLAQALSQALILHLSHALMPGKKAPPARPERGPVLNGARTRALRELIHDRLDERLTLDELAAEAGMTTHQLLIAFRAAFGTTPMQYIIRQRLRRARLLLEGTRKDITTIALECGFSSHSHLTSSFRQHLGATPSAFRERGKDIGGA